MEIWNKKKLSEVADVIGGGTPSTNNFEYWEGDIPWITPKDLSGYNERYISKGSRNISLLGLKNSSSRILPKGSVLLTSRAPIGYIAIAKNEVCTNQGFKSLVLKEGNDSQFFYYLLKNNIEYIKNMSSGSTFSEISGTQVKNLEFSIPPLETQQKIAKVLSVFDDKIELNNKINENLEQQAQAIFSNFISNCETEEIKVSDITSKANTGADAIQKAPIVDYDTGIKCIRVGDMSNNRDFYHWGYTKVSDEVFRQYQLKKDDILITRTAMLGLNKLIVQDLNAVYNNGLIRLTVNKNKIFPLILYRQFQTQDFFNFINRIESETSVRPNMKINYLLNYQFKIPNITKQKELVVLLSPLFLLKEHVSTENNKLIQLRDTLLPKLMNGEIDVDKIKI
ncbi:MAG: restriction endonuclease subunit S [Elusimicrobia bacterium]|nr:restriction endonuclease subunit S [Elusimicrobiota bacterium]